MYRRNSGEDITIVGTIKKIGSRRIRFVPMSSP